MKKFQMKIDFGTVLGTCIILTTCFILFWLMPTVGKQNMNYKERCEANHGKMINTRNRNYCIRKEVFIDIT